MADELFADRYRLERRLGVGGMSTVRLAFDTRLERYDEVKLLAVDHPVVVADRHQMCGHGRAAGRGSAEAGDRPGARALGLDRAIARLRVRHQRMQQRVRRS